MTKVLILTRTFTPLIVGVLTVLLINVGLYWVLPPSEREYYVQPARTYALEFDQPYYSIGWYGTETSADGTTFKWTGRQDARIILPLRGQDALEVILRVMYLPAEPDALRLLADQTEIALVREEQVYRGLIPQAARLHPDQITLQLAADQIITPSLNDPDSRDRRRLGVAVDWMIIRPVSRPGELIEFDPGTPEGVNWYGTEINGDNGSDFRWTSAPNAQLPLTDLPTDQPFRLELAVIATYIPDGVDTIGLALDGEALIVRRDDREGRMIISADVPPRTSSTADLTISVAGVGSPTADGRGDDGRVLGVQVDWLRIVVEGNS